MRSEDRDAVLRQCFPKDQPVVLHDSGVLLVRADPARHPDEISSRQNVTTASLLHLEQSRGAGSHYGKQAQLLQLWSIVLTLRRPNRVNMYDTC